MTDNKSHDDRDFDAKVTAGVEADSAEGKWYGNELEVKSDPIIDPGTGETVVLRVFEFKINPELSQNARPSNQELFNSHATQIRHMLFKDGLIAFEGGEGLEPRVQFSKLKREYRIIVPCKAKLGQSFQQKAQVLPVHLPK